MIASGALPLHAGLIGTELLAGIKLDDFPAGLGGFLNRFEDAEPVERVSLAAEGESADFAILGNWRRASQDRCGQQHGGGRQRARDDL